MANVFPTAQNLLPPFQSFGRGPMAFLFTAYVIGAVPVAFYLATCGGHWGWGGQGATQAGAVMPIPWAFQLRGMTLLASGPGAVLDNPVTFRLRSGLGTVPFGPTLTMPAGAGFGSIITVQQSALLAAGTDLAVAYDSPLGQLGAKNLGLTMVVWGEKQ